MPALMKYLLFVSSLVSSAISLAIPNSGPISSSRKDTLGYGNLFDRESRLENNAIDILRQQLIDPTQLSDSIVPRVLRMIIDSHLRRNLYREKMVERVPTDTVIDTPGVEYIAGVGARYMESLIHHARQIKSDDANLADLVELLGKIEDDQSRIEAVDDLIFSMALSSHEDSISAPAPGAQDSSINKQNAVDPEAVAVGQDSKGSGGLVFAESASKNIDDIINKKDDTVSGTSTISPDEFEVSKTEVIASWE
ncbi:secreted protein [Melampsora americana]|nr:secreted protein [Melampsora americana]